MPINNRVAAMHGEITAWRRDIHAHPELLYDVHRTAASVAEKLRAFGCDEVATGLGRTGVVGLIRGRRPAKGGERVIGLRADMDALPITEATGAPYASQNPGKMHACGHDGHTAMLLGAAKYLTETRNFAGTAAVIFQPAEEGGAGAKAMINDGLMDRFRIEEVYGMHNFPGLPVGHFAIRSGPVMAATDTIIIDIEGVGGHAARPQFTIDPILVGAQIISQVQSVVARNVDPQRFRGHFDLRVPGWHRREYHSADCAAARHRAQLCAGSARSPGAPPARIGGGNCAARTAPTPS